MIYAAHPIANLFPMMSDEAFEDLKNDIKEHGLRDPITIYENKILDGRNRYKACLELGIEPDVVVVDDGENPWQFVWSKNITRRHLSTSQRSSIGAELVLGSKGWAEKQAELQARANEKREATRGGDGKFHRNRPDERARPEVKDKGRTNAAKEVSKVAEVSSTTAERAIRVMKNAPDLHDKVKKGEMTVAKADKKLKERKSGNGSKADSKKQPLKNLNDQYVDQIFHLKITETYIEQVDKKGNPVTWDMRLARLIRQRLNEIL